MATYLPPEKGTTIRMPSTANLMIDSADGPREAGLRVNPWDFQITKSQSILNGFFTRIGATEVVLEWNRPNISADLSNNVLVFDVSGASPVTYSVGVSDGFYTVEALLTTLQSVIEVATPHTMDITVGLSGEPVSISFPGTPGVSFKASNLAFALGLGLPSPPQNVVYPSSPYNTDFYLLNVDLRPYRYIDFTSIQLTYNQDLKDGATNNANRDVLCRWYFSWETEPALDAYGFPILMGYTPFTVRRLFNPPKQIRWNNDQPIGNLAFQVYDNNGNLVKSPPYDAKTNWLMTLQVSEV